MRYRGEHGTLLNWFSRLPQAMVDVRPRIRTGHAWSLVLTRRYAEADAELNALEKMHVTEEGGDVRSEVEMIRCVYYALSDQTLLARSTSAAWLKSLRLSDPRASAAAARRHGRRRRLSARRRIARPSSAVAASRASALRSSA